MCRPVVFATAIFIATFSSLLTNVTQAAGTGSSDSSYHIPLPACSLVVNIVYYVLIRILYDIVKDSSTSPHDDTIKGWLQCAIDGCVSIILHSRLSKILINSRNGNCGN